MQVKNAPWSDKWGEMCYDNTSCGRSLLYSGMDWEAPASKHLCGNGDRERAKRSIMISCRFCGTSNSREESRCFRCGRRLHLANARPAPDSYRPASTTVRDSVSPPLPQPLQILSDAVADAPASFVGADGSGRATAAKMAPIAATPPRAMTMTHPLPSPVPGQMAGLPGEGEWGSLSFQQAKEKERVPESDIYTDDSVAPLPARALAGVYDAMVMLGAFGLMAVAYALMTWNLGADPVPESWLGWAIYSILGVAVVFFYRSLFILAGGDSPGMRWAGLRLVTFDGEAPTVQDRFMRVAWGGLSALPLGLGLAWALVDQERLTWHDLLSKTFPSPDSTPQSAPRWSR